MPAFILKRLGLALLVALAVSLIAFALVRLSGDVATALAGEGARAEDVEAVRRAYGLDRPLIVQYLEWLWRTVRGDFGTSLYFKTDVIGLVMDKLPTTLILAVLSLAFALLISIPLGVAAAVWRGGWVDRLALGPAGPRPTPPPPPAPGACRPGGGCSSRRGAPPSGGGGPPPRSGSASPSGAGSS